MMESGDLRLSRSQMNKTMLCMEETTFPTCRISTIRIYLVICVVCAFMDAKSTERWACNGNSSARAAVVDNSLVSSSRLPNKTRRFNKSFATSKDQFLWRLGFIEATFRHSLGPGAVRGIAPRRGREGVGEPFLTPLDIDRGS